MMDYYITISSKENNIDLDRISKSKVNDFVRKTVYIDIL